MFKKEYPLLKEEYYFVHEVYYYADDSIRAYTISPVEYGGESITEILEDMEKIKECFDKPILEYEKVDAEIAQNSRT